MQNKINDQLLEDENFSAEEILDNDENKLQTLNKDNSEELSVDEEESEKNKQEINTFPDLSASFPSLMIAGKSIYH